MAKLWAYLWNKYPFIRFLLIGGSNTVFTTVIMAFISVWLGKLLAFSIVFLISSVIVSFINAKMVFQVEANFHQVTNYVLIYFVAFLAGLIVSFLLELVGLPPYTIAITLIVTVPITFFGGRVLFKK